MEAADSQSELSKWVKVASTFVQNKIHLSMCLHEHFLFLFLAGSFHWRCFFLYLWTLFTFPSQVTAASAWCLTWLLPFLLLPEAPVEERPTLATGLSCSRGAERERERERKRKKTAQSEKKKQKLQWTSPLLLLCELRGQGNDREDEKKKRKVYHL